MVKNKDEKTVDNNEVLNNEEVVPTTGPAVPPTPEPKVETKKEKKVEVDQAFERLVLETLKGAHGSGRDRMNALGVNYARVQTEVNKRIRESK